LNTDLSNITAESPHEDLRPLRGLTPNLWLLALAAFLIGLVVTLAHKPFSQPEGGDEAIWDYVSQCILRDQVPYRDVVEIKTPLSAYLSAGAMLVGRAAGLSDVIAVRLLNTVLAGLLSAITFLIGVEYLRSKLAAWIACLIALAPTHFAEWMVTGTEPKLPMVLFGMLSVYFIARRKPFCSGLFSMLACLCWQPGLMFTGVAVLMFSRYLTNWRDLAAAKVLLGAAIPLVTLLLYFYLRGALSDFWLWTIVYNLKMYAPETAKGMRETAGVLSRVLIRVFKFDLVIVALSVAGFITYLIERVRRRQEEIRVQASLFEDAIVILPLLYLVFCWINFQSGPDLIPLFPFGALFAALFVERLSSARSGNRFLRSLPLTSAVVLSVLILVRNLNYRVEAEQTLRDQETRIASLSELLLPGDKIFVHGTVEILVLLDRPNVNKHVDLRKGKDEFIAQRMQGGFSEFINDLEVAAPKVLAISRAGRLHHRDELRQWINEHYDPHELTSYEGIYLRRSH
jgi:hypothetical protein